MYLDNTIYLGLAEGERVNLPLSVCSRHGLIAGATGTGKTVTMKVLAESLSDAGVSVFLCDVKGDVSGLCSPGEASESMEKRIDKFGLRDVFTYRSFPVCLWDVYGETGHSVRATVSDMGPELLARMLELTPAQTGVLRIVFKIADDKGLLLTDLKDLRAMITHVSDHKDEYRMTYGNVATATAGGLLRALLPLETEGGGRFFSEPALDIRDWIRTDPQGRGIINLLDCVKLVQSPTLYAAFLLWLMSELYEELPEVGDAEKPKLVFFFDEAHLLFADAPKVLVQKISQVVKLIRSKGVGIWFVTQNPSDLPDAVLAQLSNRVQHALRAYTPAEQKAVRAAAQAFRPNPAFRTEDVISNLGIGEALVSVLDEAGVPDIARRTAVICPQSRMAPADAADLAAARAADGMEKYDEPFDRESAYEVLSAAAEQDALSAEREAFEKEKAAWEAKKQKEEEKAAAAAEKQREKREAAAKKKAERRRNKIESQIIGAGGYLLRRGLLSTLKRFL